MGDSKQRLELTSEEISEVIKQPNIFFVMSVIQYTAQNVYHEKNCEI